MSQDIHYKPVWFGLPVKLPVIFPDLNTVPKTTTNGGNAK